MTADQFDKIISIDATAWRHEIDLHGELFEKLSYHLPEELQLLKTQLEARLAA
jgi:phosphoenolpyruvate carboxykinase (GTP)